MSAERPKFEPKFEILTDKDDILDLYEELEHDQDLGAFGKYKNVVAATVYNTLNRANTYVIIAHGPDNEVWGITTGIILDDNTAKNWWVIRAQHNYLRGLGTKLREVEREFLIDEGVSVRVSTAETEEGKKLILSSGGTLVAGSETDYVNILTPQKDTRF